MAQSWVDITSDTYWEPEDSGTPDFVYSGGEWLSSEDEIPFINTREDTLNWIYAVDYVSSLSTAFSKIRFTVRVNNATTNQGRYTVSIDSAPGDFTGDLPVSGTATIEVDLSADYNEPVSITLYNDNSFDGDYAYYDLVKIEVYADDGTPNEFWNDEATPDYDERLYEAA